MNLRTPSRPATALAAALVMGLGLAGCSSSDTTESASGGSADGMTVAMVTPESTGEFYGAMYCGAQAAADEAGITLNIQGTPEVTVEAETAVLQSVLATDPDGLLLTVWDNNAYNQLMAPYTESGKPLIMPDSFLSNDEFVQSIRTDAYQSSYDAATQALEDFDVTGGKVLVLTDAPGNKLQSDRADGFADAVRDKGGIDVLEYAYVSSDSAKASQAVTSALAANPDLSMVFSTNSGAGTGAANGIRTAGVDSVVNLGYDTSSQQVVALRNGDYDALIGQSPYEMGRQAMDLMGQILKGDTSADDVEEKVVYAPWALVTADNVDDDDVAPFLYTTDCSQIPAQ